MSGRPNTGSIYFVVFFIGFSTTYRTLIHEKKTKELGMNISQLMRKELIDNPRRINKEVGYEGPHLPRTISYQITGNVDLGLRSTKR